MSRYSYTVSGTVKTCFTELCLRKEILTTYNDSIAKSLQEQNESEERKRNLESCSFEQFMDQSPQPNKNKPHDVVCLQNIASKGCSLECYIALTYYSKILSKKRTISCWFDFQL